MIWIKDTNYLPPDFRYLEGVVPIKRRNNLLKYELSLKPHKKPISEIVLSLYINS
jgi:hypothetical protein